jgi:hypothetical protein
LEGRNDAARYTATHAGSEDNFLKFSEAYINYGVQNYCQWDRVAWSARWAHNPEISGSNPLPAIFCFSNVGFVFLFVFPANHRVRQTPMLPIIMNDMIDCIDM